MEKLTIKAFLQIKTKKYFHMRGYHQTMSNIFKKIVRTIMKIHNNYNHTIIMKNKISIYFKKLYFINFNIKFFIITIEI